VQQRPAPLPDCALGISPPFIIVYSSAAAFTPQMEKRLMGSFSTCVRSLTLASAVVTVLSARAEAQTPHNGLRGLSQIQVVIESLDSGTTDCGVTKSVIENAVKYPLSSTKLQLTQDSAEVLYINLSSLYFTSSHLCVSNIDVEVVIIQPVVFQFSERNISAAVKLWDNGIIISSPQSQHADSVEQQIERLVKHFVTDWNLDNKDEQ
jgi:hypothetical protein